MAPHNAPAGAQPSKPPLPTAKAGPFEVRAASRQTPWTYVVLRCIRRPAPTYGRGSARARLLRLGARATWGVKCTRCGAV
eukprot:356698-Chlamydomonas_euryale.AAC.1